MTKASGRFVWHDLMTTDPLRAKTYYSSLFGWGVRSIDAGAQIGAYEMLTLGEVPFGGIVHLDSAAEIPAVAQRKRR